MKAIDRVKHELMRYEADCLMALDDKECKACTAEVFDSLRSIIRRAEEEEKRTKQEIATRTFKTRRSMCKFYGVGENGDGCEIASSCNQELCPFSAGLEGENEAPQEEAEENEKTIKMGEFITDRPTLYRCDPEKNTRCTKELCQSLCRMTTEAEYSTDGRALTEEEIEEI